MGEAEEKIGADYLRLLAAKQRLSVLESEVKKMTGNLNMAISLLNGEETGHYAYHVHNRPHSSVSHRQLILPTVEELSKIVEYRKQAKDEVRCPEQTVQGARGEALVAYQGMRGSGQGQNRTADTRIFSPLLYRLSYLAKSEKYGPNYRARQHRPCVRASFRRFTHDTAAEQ